MELGGGYQRGQPIENAAYLSRSRARRVAAGQSGTRDGTITALTSDRDCKTHSAHLSRPIFQVSGINSARPSFRRPGQRRTAAVCASPTCAWCPYRRRLQSAGTTTWASPLVSFNLDALPPPSRFHSLSIQHTTDAQRFLCCASPHSFSNPPAQISQSRSHSFRPAVPRYTTHSLD